MKTIYIIKKQAKTYKVFSPFDEFYPEYYADIVLAKDLCRLRLDKNFVDNDIKTFQIPFTNTTIVW